MPEAQQVETNEETNQEIQQPENEQSVEQQASDLGWKDEGGITAQDFLDHKEILSAKETKNPLRIQLQEAESKIKKLQDGFGEFRKFQSERFEQQKTDHAEQLTELNK